jgi:hypothetical protein
LYNVNDCKCSLLIFCEGGINLKATCIWQPRYWDQKVLINKIDVRRDKCFVFFCCDRNKTDLYSYDGNKVINEIKVGTNGKIPCYEIPLDWLQSEGDLPEELVKIRTEEYAKYKRKFLKKK